MDLIVLDVTSTNKEGNNKGRRIYNPSIRCPGTTTTGDACLDRVCMTIWPISVRIWVKCAFNRHVHARQPDPPPPSLKLQATSRPK